MIEGIKCHFNIDQAFCVLIRPLADVVVSAEVIWPVSRVYGTEVVAGSDCLFWKLSQSGKSRLLRKALT